MTNLLTPTEAANCVRTETTDQFMLDLLPQVDAFIQRATGRDWTGDFPIEPVAKAAARILLVMSYDNPAMLDNNITSLPFGLTACLAQLEAISLRYKTFAGAGGAGAIELTGAKAGDSVTSVLGLIGVSGDQSANFETVITVADQIQQTSTSDLSDNYYRVLLTSLEDL